ncbi:glycosyltransferase family 2 protein [Knoellia sp. Soil729]|uniref:glycosyltransferase family 2 protein n=1 Tax=Knoellia sp. Soil729 TaxID=1736394 RepID=UPI0006F366A7|nr:glycosyltransferase [Knoellia sp. Soil729]KRE41553.1 glycosyl transferase [Knoellia sp. Soil729]
MAAVTTVVATRNRWPDLERSLPRHRAPVILVDNGSQDGTPERVRREFPHVEVVALGRNLGAVARNVGVERARTPLVAFADDDSWWEPGALDRAARLFAEHPRMALLAARLLVGDEESLDPTCAAMARSPLRRAPDLPGPSILGFLACGAVVRTSAFLEAGGFDPAVFFFGEEQRLAADLAALGGGLCYVESVVAHHHPSADRDEGSRRRRQVLSSRNAVLTAVMRRPWRQVARTVVHEGRRGAAGRKGVANAVLRSGMALRRRRLLPPEVESDLRQLELSTGP